MEDGKSIQIKQKLKLLAKLVGDNTILIITTIKKLQVQLLLPLVILLI